MGELASGPVAFLAGCREVHECLASALRASKDGAPAADVRAHEACAAGALRALLRRGDVPRDRWPAVLFAAVPLLESSHGVLSAVDTSLLAARLQELQLHPWEPALSAEPTHPEAEAQLEAVRLALARNLARCWVRAELD